MNQIDYDDAKIKFFIPLVKGKKVLDLGVVQHRLEKHNNPKWLHRAIWNVSNYCSGIDIDNKGVEFLNKKGYRVICGDVQNFRLDSQFDVIVAGDIVEHLSDIGSFLECVKNHLNSNGVLAISTPNPFWWKIWAKVILTGNAGPNPEHTCWFCEKTITQLLHRHGFQIDRIQYGSIFDLSTFLQVATKVLNCVLPLPNRLKHNTIMVVARIPKSSLNCKREVSL